MPLDSTHSPTTEVIAKAIDYFKDHGWCQGMAVYGGNRCLWGALRDAVRWGSPDMLKIVCRRVAVANDMPGEDIAAWNDAAGRTKQQVIEALENALGAAP